VITTLAIVYDTAEMVMAVERALSVKRKKGPAYSTEILLLHTLPSKGIQRSGIGMNPADLAALAKTRLVEQPELCERFGEIWFLNEYGPARLHKLK
jgi:hypothetical protein